MTFFKNPRICFHCSFYIALHISLQKYLREVTQCWIVEHKYFLVDELGPSKHHLEFSFPRRKLLHLKVWKLKMLHNLKKFSPIWDSLYPRVEVQKYHKKGHSHGISGSHRNRKYRKSCEKAWLRRFLAQLQAQEIGTNWQNASLCWTKISKPHKVSKRWFCYIS